MAHILVYLQRTPVGLHPASAVALCRARDISSDRGATLTAICSGDAGALDRGVAQAAGSFGADVLVFGGPNGLAMLSAQLNPVHVLVPWTEEGLAQANSLSSDPPVTRWLTTRQPAWGGADAITAVLAGTLPWHGFNEMLEAEYQADVDEVTHPSWVAEVSAACAQDTAPVFSVGSRGPVRWFGGSVDAETQAVLNRLGAQPAGSDEVITSGTVLWMSTDPVPQNLAVRPVTARLIVLPGEHAGLDPSWHAADWVLSGPRATALGAILDSPWASLSG